MSKLLSKLSKGSSARERIGEGAYPARIVQVIRLGTQHEEYKGEAKVSKQLWITFEIPEKTIEIEGVARPRWISSRVTESSNEKARFTGLVNATAQHGSIDNYPDLLGKPVTVTIGTTSGGKDKVIGMSAVPKQFAASIAELQNVPVFWDIDNPDHEVFDSFPDFLKEIINSSDEASVRKSEAPTTKGKTPPPKSNPFVD